MKILLLLLFPVFIFMSLSGCSRSGLPAGPESPAAPDGMWKSDGIIPWAGSFAEVKWSFLNGELIWNVNYYSKNNPDSQLVFSNESSYTLGYAIDNSFIVINPPAGNKVWSDSLFLHFKVEGNKMALDPGRIYSGQANILTGTFWEARGNWRPGVGPDKYVYYTDNTGIFILSSRDTVRFTYTIEGRTIYHNYNHHGNLSSYTAEYEIRDHKLYMYDKPGLEQRGLGSARFTAPFAVEPLTLLSSTVPETDTKDYFPLKTGSRWEFDYLYYPSSYAKEYTRGKLTWKIISAAEDPSAKLITYTVCETFSGIKTGTYNPGDTTVVGPDTAYFFITENALHRLTMNSLLTSIGKVTINRFYSPNTPDEVTVVTANYTYHEIKLINSKGIKTWSFSAGPYAGSSGKLTLIKSELAL